MYFFISVWIPSTICLERKDTLHFLDQSLQVHYAGKFCEFRFIITQIAIKLELIVCLCSYAVNDSKSSFRVWLRYREELCSGCYICWFISDKGTNSLESSGDLIYDLTHIQFEFEISPYDLKLRHKIDFAPKSMNKH